MIKVSQCRHWHHSLDAYSRTAGVSHFNTTHSVEMPAAIEVKGCDKDSGQAVQKTGSRSCSQTHGGQFVIVDCRRCLRNKTALQVYKVTTHTPFPYNRTPVQQSGTEQFEIQVAIRYIDGYYRLDPISTEAVSCSNKDKGVYTSARLFSARH